MFCDFIGRIARDRHTQYDLCSYEANAMMEALDRYLRAGFFWFWIGVGILLAFNSYDGYGTGMGALFFGIAFLFYGLRRLKNRKSGAGNVRLQRIAVSIYSVGVFVSVFMARNHLSKSTKPTLRHCSSRWSSIGTRPVSTRMNWPSSCLNTCLAFPSVP